MLTDAESQIIAVEERLRLAMLSSDVGMLDELISPDLIFTDHTGQVYSKQDDLDIHASGVLKFHTLEPSQRQIKIYDQIAIVSVRMKLSGIHHGSAIGGDFRYTRIWHLTQSNVWQIVAGHISEVQ